MKRNYIYISVFSVFVILISACEADTSTSSGGGDNTILSSATTPLEVSGVTGITTDRSIILKWQAPTLTSSHKKADGQALTKADVSYKVYRVAKGGSNRTVAEIKAADKNPIAVAKGTTSTNITNLTPATTYEIVVQAVNSTDTTKVSAGTKAEVTTLSTNQATSPPDARNVTGSSTDISARITWQEPTLTSSHKKADGQALTKADVSYKVYRVAKGAGTRTVAQIKEADTTPLAVAEGTTSINITNLNKSTTYEVVVQAVNATDTTKASTGVKIEVTTLATNQATAPPDARSVTAGSPTDTSVGISWTAPDLTSSHKKADGQNLTAADVYYKVYRVVKGSNARDVAEIKEADKNPIAVAKGTTSVNITNLTTTTTYEVVVQAVNSTDPTKASTGIRIEVTTDNLATAPAEARSVTGSPIDTSVGISWQAPDLTSSHKKADGQRLTIADVSYKVYRVAKGSDARDVAEIKKADATPLTVVKGTTSVNITNLNKTTTYEVVVQAVNSTDTTKVSTGVKIEVTTLATNQATAPADARSVTAGSPTDTSVGISWTAPDLTSSHTKANGQRLTTADVSYKVYRVAKGSDARDVAEIIAADNNPLAVAKGTTSINITNLTHTTTYEIVVQAINATDTTKVSTGVKIEVTTDNLATAPADARSVTGSPTDISARITWQEPNLTSSHKKADGQALTKADVSYKVYRVAKGAGTRTVAQIKEADNNPLAVAKGTTSVNITNLNKNTTYEVVVQAVNSTDITKVSTGLKIEVTTLATNQATASPDARNVRGSPTDNSVGISWTAPDLTSSHKKANGQSLTTADVYYKVYRVVKGSNARTIVEIKEVDTTPLEVAKGTTSTTINNLTGSTTYEIVVQAVNSTDPTKASTGIRIEVATTNPATAPADARSVTGSPTNTSVGVSWQEPNFTASHKKADGTRLTQADVSYKVYHVAKGAKSRTVAEIIQADNSPLAVAKGTTKANISNLTPITTYEIVVQAVNTTDTTKVSTGVRIEVITTSEATAPAEVSRILSTISFNSSNIIWAAPRLSISHKKADGTQLTQADVSYKVYHVAKGVQIRTVAQIIAADTNPLAVAKGTTRASISNLMPGTTYEIVIQAVNATDTTKVSTGVKEELTTRTSQATAPSDARSVTGSPTDTSVGVSWQVPNLTASHKEADGSRLTQADVSYKVYHVAKGNNVRTVAQIISADTTPITVAKGTTKANITNLTLVTTYEIVVQAINSTDPAKSSTGVRIEVTTTDSATAPADAHSVIGSPTDTSVEVSWQAPNLSTSHKKADGTRLTQADVSYKVYHVAKGSDARTVAQIISADTTPITVAKGTTSTSITNLTGSTTYEIVVRAVNSTDTTKISTGVKIEVATTNPATAPANARSVTGSSTGTNIGVSWQAPSLTLSHKKTDGTRLTQADVSYKVYHVAKGAKSRTAAEIISADKSPITVAKGTTSASIKNLTGSTTYEIVVQAVNSTDTTKVSTGVKIEVTTSQASAPPNIPAASLGVGQNYYRKVTISWTGPNLTASHKKANGQQLRDDEVVFKVYRVEKGQNARTVAQIIAADNNPLDINILSATINNLNPATTYEIVVQAVNSTDTTKVSTGIKTEVTTLTYATNPADARSVTAVSITDKAVKVSWQVPNLTVSHKKPDGTQLTQADVSYKVYRVAKGAKSRTVKEIIAADTNSIAVAAIAKGTISKSINISNLIFNTTYEIVVQAINAIDTTKVSTGVRVEVLANPATLPPEVGNIVRNPLDTSVKISWSPSTLTSNHKKANGQALTKADIFYNLYFLEKGARSRTVAQIKAIGLLQTLPKGLTSANVTSLSGKSLKPNTTYEIVVQAVNSTDTTKFSTGIREEVTTLVSLNLVLKVGNTITDSLTLRVNGLYAISIRSVVTPSVSGGTFHIYPNLTRDTGISFNTNTGVISGKATKAQKFKTYTITFTATDGRTASTTIRVLTFH